jgi:peroxiredoxin
MVALQSNELLKNFSCPSFSLPSVDNKNYVLADFDKSKALLVLFICNHCPYVKALEQRIIALRKKYSIGDLAMVAVCSNDAQKYPEDSKEALYERWLKQDYGFPYLIDEDQKVAQAFDAVCTPDIFLFDTNRKLFYHGQFDDNWRDYSQVKKHNLADAIDMLLSNKDYKEKQVPSLGCSIKWK